MRNVEIIEIEKMAHEIPEETVVCTLPEWNRRGKKVKNGEHAVFVTRIWKPRKQKKAEDDIDEEVSNSRMIFVKAAFFTEAQVE